MNTLLHNQLILKAPFGYAYHKIITNESGQPIDYEFIEVNPAFERLTGFNSDDIVGKTIREIVPEIAQDDFDWIGYYGEVATKGGEKDFEQYAKLQNRWYKVQVYSPDMLFFVTIFSDITDRIQIEKALQRSESDLKRAQQITHIGNFHIDLQTNEVTWTEELYKIYGFDSSLPPPLLNDSQTLFTRESWALLSSSIANTVETGVPYEIELKTLLKSGGNGWIWARGEAVRDAEGNITGIWGAVQDITERKQIEEELRKSQEAFQGYFTMSSVGICVTSPDKGWVDVNDELCQMLGYSKSELSQLTWAELTHPDDLEADMIFFDQVLSGTIDRYELDKRFIRKDGSIIHTSLNVTCQRNDDGSVLHFLSFLLDITHRRLAEKEIFIEKERTENLLKETQKQKAEIELQNERLESLLRITQYRPNSNQDLLDFALKEAIELTSSKLGYIYYYNEQSRQFTLNTWSKEVMRECSVMDPQTVYDLDKTGCWGEAVRQRKPIVINDYSAENQYKQGTPQGHVALTKFLTIPVFIDDTIVAVVGVANKTENYQPSDVRQLTLLMDSVWRISERESLFDNLKMAKAKAEESDRLKSAFLANMSHEIRTPMNGILGFAELLKEPHLTDKEQAKYISIIEKSGLRMLNIINDIVDISKIESGQMEVVIGETNINDQIEHLFSFFKPEVEAKGMTLSVKCALSSKNATLFTDREKLYAVLTNLIKNAIKYSTEGSIEFGYEKKGDALEFFVKDTGIGIPVHRQAAVFERFIQADISNTMAHDGSGLGLSISRAYIEMLNGKIWVESEVGKGTEFYFTIPYSLNPEEKDKATDGLGGAASENRIGKLKILIAEDDEDSAFLLSTILKEAGPEILFAKTGLEVIDIYRRHPDLQLILMDIKMPEMDGYEATRQIRLLNKEIIIIAQTAFGLSSEKDRAIDAGCNECISKPIIKTELYGLIEKYFSWNSD